ncbi:MAG: phytoene desaturase [Bacteroidetes bacterium]|nr:MAG: phytoene desaturase [Bacteroidota bacterium]
MNKKVIIVGTGLGGLSTGLRLATRGYQVHFIEKGSQPGGRLNQLKKDGFTFDVGPSFFSMPYEFEELVEDCKIAMPFEFVELDPLYTVHFRGSNRKFSLYKDIDKLSAQFKEIEPNFKARFTAYLKRCETLYNDTVDIVIKQNFDTIPGYIKALMQVPPRHLPILLKTFWKQSSSFFESEEAQQIVSLIAFFLGRTPFDTNAVYTLLSHIEFTHTGYYNVKGGMYNIVTGLVKALKAHNATFEYNTEITDFSSEGEKVTALIDQNGRSWEADIFLINADAALFRGTVFKRKRYSPEKLKKMHWTMGYLTFYVGIKTRLPEVAHHNYFLGDNYRNYAKEVIKHPGVLEKPYYYVNVLSKHNRECAPEGCEALFFVCPVPNLLYKKDWSDKQEIIDSIIEDFSKRIGRDLSKEIILQMAYTPEEWQNHFNLYKGAGLGLSHDMMQIGALRPKNYDEQYKNTFYVGASTIPGAGLPMAVISSKLAAERIYTYP